MKRQASVMVAKIMLVIKRSIHFSVIRRSVRSSILILGGIIMKVAVIKKKETSKKFNRRIVA